MDNDIAAAVDGVWSASFPAQESRVSAQEQALVALVAGTLGDACLEAAQRAAHKLAGSLGTFGLDEGSRLASEIEATWRAETIDYAHIAELARSIGSLRGMLEARRPSPRSVVPQSAPAPEHPAEIWLVDDDEVFARYVLAPLQRRYRITWLSSGESALDTLARADTEQYPRLILLDIEMPGIKGLKVLEQLVDQGVLDRSAIVMLTRRSQVEDVVQARKLGALDFLAKPISVTTLTERVDRALETVR